MKNLGKDIESAIASIVEGIDYELSQQDYLDSDKIQTIMRAKIEAFDSAKEIINMWFSSPNRPSKKIVKKYLLETVERGDKALKQLSYALSININYEDLDTTKHAVAVKSKKFLLRAIYDMEAGIRELSEKIEAEDFVIKEREFKLGYPEKVATYRLLPERRNIHKDWLNKREDAVKICPHGTEGEVIVIDELSIQLPKVPDNKKDILFWDKPKEYQYWMRPDIPDVITPDNVDQWHDFIIQEFYRRVHGVWFYNNGVPTYLTGDYYFSLTHAPMKDNGGFMDFRIAQLRMSYHMTACIVDERCLGQIFLKSRRTGFTYLVLFSLLNSATLNANKALGMTSKTGADVEEAFGKFSYAFLNLPFYFRPVVKGKEDSLRELFFGKPSNTSKEAKKSRDTSTGDYLNTSIDWRNTKNGSYDSVKLDRYLGDECFAPGTKILMYDMSRKSVEDIIKGDVVMGADAYPKRVTKLFKGIDNMYRVSQPYAKDYVVNSQHKLRFAVGNSKSRTKEVFMTAEDYLKSSDYKKKITRRVEFKGYEGRGTTALNPYFVGLWLGDGFSRCPKIIINHKKDPEVLSFVEDYVKQLGMSITITGESTNWKKLYLKKGDTPNNPITQGLKDMGVLNNKHIPKKLLFYSRETRLEILAGIVDSDGYTNGKTTIQIGMSRKSLVEGIKDLAMSCGLGTSNITTKTTNHNTKAYLLNITDYKGEVPIRVQRKKTKAGSNSNRRSKVYIKPEGIGEYFGFSVGATTKEGQLIVLGDYTVTKNCGKWERPEDYIEHFGMVSPTMMPAGKVVGKAFLGSTMGSRDKGGQQMIELYLNSKPSQRNPTTGKTPTALYKHFLSAQDNMEEFTDKYGFCHSTKPEEGTFNIFGKEITMGSEDYLLAVEEDKKKQSDKALNEQQRTYPRSEELAMRDDAADTTYNTTKLYDQLDYNDKKQPHEEPVRGNFIWKDMKDEDVVFMPDSKGRFLVSWIPSKVDGTESLKNNVLLRNGLYYPGNMDLAGFGVDPFSLKSAHKGGSDGAMHVKTNMFPEGGAPANKFIVEYIARPPDEHIFFEDVIKCARFYGIPVLVESNRIDLLRYMRNRGYRKFATNRLDRPWDKLNPNEKEYGGQPMSGKDMLDSHMNAIGNWIERYVGYSTNEEFRSLGQIDDNMPFNETLRDWLIFDPDKRTKFDATISSGLAIMACSKERYKGKVKAKKKTNLKGVVQKYKS